MANNQSTASTISTVFPVLAESERDALVARARAKLFELLRLYEIDMPEDAWPELEFGLQLRINQSPELMRRFWWQPEEVIVQLMRTPWTNEEVAKLFPNEVAS